MGVHEDGPEARPGRAEDAGPSYIVGIGASAGGLDALESFFRNMPSATNLSFVVIQHLSPDHKSMMAELLGRFTSMPSSRVEDGMVPAPGRVYVNPPNNNVVLEGRRLRLRAKEPNHIVNLPIDVFLRSLADSRGEHGIAVVLSGTGSDGTRGVRAVKEAGGLVVVQDVASARFDGMPRSALSTGVADFVMPPEEMPAALLAYAEGSGRWAAEAPTRLTGEDEEGLSRIIGLLLERTGNDFSFYRTSTVVRRIDHRMIIARAPTLQDYIDLLGSSAEEVQALHRELLIGVTRLFRDPDAFVALRDAAVPRLFREAQGNEPLRVWVVGCSTGEEAYSIAMLLHDHGERIGSRRPVRIFATDVDRESLAVAGEGLYPGSVLADLLSPELYRYFAREGGQCRIVQQIREMVVFAVHNVISDPPFSHIDLLSCRNLLIYLQPAMQRKVLNLFGIAVRPGGVLFLGSSESIGDLSVDFQVLDGRWKLFHRRHARRARVAPGGTVSAALEPRHRVRPLLRERADSEVLQALVAEFVPPSFVIDEGLKLVHVHGDVGHVLRLRTGPAQLSVVDMVDREMGIAISTAVSRARQDGREVVYGDVGLAPGGPRVEIRVRRLDVSSGRPLYLVVLPPRCLPEDAPREDGSQRARIADLEVELLDSRQSLQATVEQLETTNEELHASNEELIASNEELQSTIEELQSVNEELYALNVEHRDKIAELTDRTADVDNLLGSTDVGTILVDKGLIVRRYNGPAAEWVNLLAQDVGRPLQHVRHSLLRVDLVADAVQVLATGQRVEREARSETGRWVLLRSLPYRRGEEPDPVGVVVTMVDVSPLAHAQAEVQALIDALPMGVVVLDNEGGVRWVNRGWRELSAVEPVVGETYEAACLRALAADPQHARSAAEGVGRVLRAEAPRFEARMLCGPQPARWVAVEALPVEGAVSVVLILHRLEAGEARSAVG